LTSEARPLSLPLNIVPKPTGEDDAGTGKRNAVKTVIAGTAFAAFLCACAANPPPSDSPAPAKVAAAVPAAPATGAAKVSADPNTVICRHDRTPLASHIPVKNCHTKAEWAEIDKANAANVQQFNRSLAAARGPQNKGAPP
jgi:hypothetical protein